MLDQIPQLTAHPIPVNEKERLQALRSLNILDTNEEQLYDDITRVALALTGSGGAAINLIDENRVWFKSSIGFELKEIHRQDSICQHAIMGNDLFEVSDTLEHEDFKCIPYVAGEPHLRYYAGVPLAMPGNLNIGTLCLFDVKPKKLTSSQAEALKALANTVVQLITLRRNFTELHSSQNMISLLQEINEDFIKSPENKHDLFKKMLDFVVPITGSEFGFIGEVFIQNGKRALRTYAITDISWNKETSDLYHANEQRGMVFTNHDTLFGYTLKTGETVISNDPANDPKSGGTPKGHPPLKRFMGVAIKDSKGDLIGMIGLANKKEEFIAQDLEVLQPFVSTCGTMIIALHSLQEQAVIQTEKERIQKQLLAAQSIAKMGSWQYDAATNETQWSDELYRIFELPIDGYTLNYKAYHSRIDPEDFDLNENILAQSIDSGRSFAFEERLVFPDGRKKTVWVNGTPQLDAEGKVICIQGTTQDITLNKRQELEVQRFFDLAVDLFCIASADGYFLRTSRSFVSTLGFCESELKEIPFFDFVHPDDKKATEDEMDFIVRGGTSRNFENRYRKKSGGYATLAWTAIFDEVSRLVYASAKDVTEKRELEKNLIESQIEAEKLKAKDTFLANMSHEIRTPLNAIIGFNEILSRTTLTAEQRKNVDFVSNASKTLSVLINDILDISKLESGKLELENEPFRIESIVRQVVHMHSSNAKSKGIKLVLSYDTEIPEVLIGDETRLSQILTNLVSNAIKFTEKGSVEIRVVETALHDNMVGLQFEIKDTGIGIMKDKLKLIFERFTQAESYTTRVYGGTGLGLNIVQSLVELHKGVLAVDSKWGKGSTFTVSLEYPIASAEDIQNLDRDQIVADGTRLSGMSILLVEDNEHNQILAETYLTKNNAVVDKASNGKIALEMVREKSYDVILMDIQMPIMDGLATTYVMRGELEIETPIVACSAHAMASERMKCKAAGMNDYISKPYSEEVLVSTLAKYRKAPSAKSFALSDDFATILIDLERNISKTYAEKIVGIFKQRLPHEIHLLQQAMEERDMKLIEERAHYQAGSMSSLRFTQGYQLAHTTERAAADHVVDQALAGADHLVNYLQKLLDFLNTRFLETKH